MKVLTSILILLTFCLNKTESQQFYLLDSMTTVSLFGGSSGGTFASKYKYDSQFRLISHLSENYEITNEYSNQYDFVNRYTSLQNNIVYNQTINTHNSEGFLVDQYLEQHDFNTNSLIPNSRKVFEYDQENRMILDEFYYFNNLGIETLSQRKSISYNEFGIEEEILEYYQINSSVPYQTNTLTHFYDDDRITLSVTVIEYSTQTNTSEKIFTYESDKLISTQEDYYSNGEFNASYLNIFEYTDHGVHNYLFTKYNGSAEYILNSTIYESELLTPFFDKDTSTVKFHFGDDFFEEQKTYNSVQYSTTEDTAIVRTEFRSKDFEFFEFIQVSKAIHIRFGDPISTTNMEEIVAEIYPNPILSGSFININRIDSTINKYEIINAIGQAVALGSIWTENMVIESPEIPGQYYIRFFEDNLAKGNIVKLNVF